MCSLRAFRILTHRRHYGPSETLRSQRKSGSFNDREERLVSRAKAYSAVPSFRRCFMTRDGKCACGQLVVRCEGEPDVVAMCHCFDCQRRTGSVFSVHAWFSVSHVSLPKIGFGQFSRKANSGREVRFGFCHNCGGTVFWEADLRPGFVAVAVGAFADPTFAGPTQVYFADRKHRGVEDIAISANSLGS